MAELTKDERSAHELKVNALSEKLGYKVCGARTRDLKPCSNRAGKGTDHVGEGKCKYHGGSASNITAKNFKHGLYSKIKTQHPQLRKKMEELADDKDVFDLRQEILKLRAICEIMADQEDLMAAAKLAVDVSKVIERLHTIEVGRRYVISIENVSVIIQSVQQAIFRHVPDEFTRHLIAQELSSTRLSIALPNPEVIEAEYEAVGAE
jgi:hypothetical protein